MMEVYLGTPRTRDVRTEQGLVEFSWNGGETVRQLRASCVVGALELAEATVRWTRYTTDAGPPVVDICARLCDAWPEGHVTSTDLWAILDAVEAADAGRTPSRVPVSRLPAIADLCDYLGAGWAVAGVVRELVEASGDGHPPLSAVLLAVELVRADVASRRWPRSHVGQDLWEAAAGVVRATGGVARDLDYERIFSSTGVTPRAVDLLHLVRSERNGGLPFPFPRRWLETSHSFAAILARSTIEDVREIRDDEAAIGHVVNMGMVFLTDNARRIFTDAILLEAKLGFK